jgi:hypothetical protein
MTWLVAFVFDNVYHIIAHPCQNKLIERDILCTNCGKKPIKKIMEVDVSVMFTSNSLFPPVYGIDSMHHPPITLPSPSSLCIGQSNKLVFLYTVGVVILISVAVIVDVIVTAIIVIVSAFPSVPSSTPNTKSLLIVVLSWQLLLREGVMKLIPSSTVSTIG